MVVLLLIFFHCSLRQEAMQLLKRRVISEFTEMGRLDLTNAVLWALLEGEPLSSDEGAGLTMHRSVVGPSVFMWPQICSIVVLRSS